MGGFDDHGGIIGDWMPPSSSPRSFFAAMLGDDSGSRTVSEPPPKPDNNNDSGFTFPGPDRQGGSENGDGNQRGLTVDQATKKGEFGEQRMSSRAGLVERMAARAGHNAPRLNTDIIKPADSLQNQQVRSPYLTIPPGLSPTSLLDSPVFLSNSLVQPSPTTGKFQFAPNGNGKSSMMFLDSSNRNKDNFFEDPNNSSFAFKPFPDHVNPPFMSTQSFQTNEALVQPEKQFPPQKIEVAQNETSSLHIRADFPRSSTEKKPEANFLTPFESFNGNSERNVQRLEDHDDDDADQRISGDNANNAISASSEDGYNWRKYGQKQVKGSEYPRSYYKCTHPNCLVKKKVERSHEGHITEIIYKGAHNHPKLAPNRRSGIGSSIALSDMQSAINEQGGNGVDGGPSWGTNMQKGNGHWSQESSNLEVTSSGLVMQGQNGQFESSEAVDGSSTFSNDEEEDDRATHGSVSLAYDGEGDESESKRRKVEAYAADVSGATRAIREPRVVVQTTSEVDILDDGYRWRKYGQKVVKGNPNPRSYYKCTSTGCTVRKHVERASHDLKSVITTYEGKHNHDVPAARNSSHANNTMAAQALSIHPQVHMPEPSRIQNTMARFDRPPFGLPGGPQLGPTPTHGYGFAMSQQGPGGLAHMAMANHGKMPVLPVHHYLGQPRQMNEMGFVLPKGEPKVEPMSDPGLNGAPMYHQMMNRLPLGPQM
ncbi:probable WRKY transcription factor 34 isoform X1 [Cynara cardunculus var. scolymus]|uniref:probable WRKY transcription factor 34 isoform X1 n=1 Tax=Cynara cardunculus var. scolymus TaxID=59895 RepID=UPI000D624D9B|nr:probable WRKY transcription factor 34 isoform X1 [Cynara cardunculus var. scolymus]XP_024966450.1 probable WRKY transcription factor 34 isoform X1 [Cynara cardunculus var. scolymus]